MKKTAVVILNWNGKKLMEKFLPALIENIPHESVETIVADNGSTDDSLLFLTANYPQIKQITLDKNYGFAEGYNKALAKLDHEYVVLLNSDVEVTPNWLDAAINYLDEHKDVVALQPKILAYKDPASFEYAGACGGYLDVYGYPFCRGRILNTVENDLHQYDEPTDILWASGACLFIRLKEYIEAGGLDSVFFAHQEEIDLCWRLVNRGKKIVCLPSSVVYHVGGATLKMENPHKTFLNFRNNQLMLYKNLPDKYLSKVMLTRFWLDRIAALQFLLKGHPANAKAIFKARKEFKALKGQYKEIRQDYLAKSSPELSKLIYRKSLIFAYYFKNKKKYNQLFK